MYVFFMLRKKLLNGSHSNVQEENYAVLKTGAWKKKTFKPLIHISHQILGTKLFVSL